MATIRIPTPLRAYVGGSKEVNTSGGTVGEALADLTGQYPDLEPHLYNDGQLRSFVNIFLGEEDIRYLDGVETPIDDDTQLRIIPSIAGG
jgi:molybdopterin converting factor small subunit